eukprot:GHVU01047557.1.p3 GENE.GHVU01047557.1~~GHVU01047557.1.p3  ORF type:complete len:116 (+),score=22.88 GHVU01047557.1:513-860(+)
MLECRFSQGHVLKKIFDAVKDLAKEVNLECADTGLQLQAMDPSHVALVALDMKEAAFDQYRCDRNRTLGLNVESVVKVFKLCGNDDAVTIRHEDESDTISFVFESASESVSECLR